MPLCPWAAPCLQRHDREGDEDANEGEEEADPLAQQLWPGLAEEDLASLEAACSLAASAIWQPAYGCAVLALPGGEPDTQPVPGTLALAIVGLDGWEYDTHRCACCRCCPDWEEVGRSSSPFRAPAWQPRPACPMQVWQAKHMLEP